ICSGAGRGLSGENDCSLLQLSGAGVAGVVAGAAARRAGAPGALADLTPDPPHAVARIATAAIVVPTFQSCLTGTPAVVVPSRAVLQSRRPLPRPARTRPTGEAEAARDRGRRRAARPGRPARLVTPSRSC